MKYLHPDLIGLKSKKLNFINTFETNTNLNRSVMKRAMKKHSSKQNDYWRVPCDK